jgi:hypothetical protein
VDCVEQTFELILPAIDSVRVMVAGELVVDRYTSGVVARISPEAPIPVLKLTDRTARLGNAGFVAANLRAMGAEVTILSVVGEDSSGQFLRNMLTDCGALVTGIVTDPSRPTIVKERFLGSVQAAKRLSSNCSGSTRTLRIRFPGLSKMPSLPEPLTKLPRSTQCSYAISTKGSSRRECFARWSTPRARSVFRS